MSEGDVWDFYDYKRKAEGCLPVGVVLTIAATGSEMSASSVITKEEGLVKRGYSSDFARPKFAVMNPELTMTLPDYQTACGCTDILMHTMERYFNGSGTMELTDALAEGLLRTVMENARILVKDPKNYDARAEIMWAGSLSHNGLTGCGSDGGDWATHKLEHEIGGLFDVAHGAGLAAIWGSWARYVYKDCLPRFVKFAVNVMGEKRPDAQADCQAGNAKDGGQAASMAAGLEAPQQMRRLLCGALKTWKSSSARSRCRRTCGNLVWTRLTNSWRRWRASARKASAAVSALRRSCGKRICSRFTGRAGKTVGL